MSPKPNNKPEDGSQNPQKTAHTFWDTQPMIKDGMSDGSETEGPIDPAKDVHEINQAPLRLPKGFRWELIDITDAEHLSDVYDLLSNHYVEDDDHIFRFDYSKKFLLWALCPPGYKPQWHLCIRAENNNKILALITGTPVTAVVNKKAIKVAEINFLCVHKQLRSKRLAPVLIKELTRRVNLEGVWQAVYTAGIEITKPLTRNRYFHRQINTRKLIEINFASLDSNLKLRTIEKLHELPKKTTCQLTPLAKEDIQSAMELVNGHLERFALRLDYCEEDFGHWFLPRDKVINTYVVKEGDKVTDLISFYVLSSKVLNNHKHNGMSAAYSLYTVAKTVSGEVLMRDGLILARDLGMDVFNALDLMDNRSYFTNLMFKRGSGVLHYYIYNWKCEQINPEQNSLILF